MKRALVLLLTAVLGATLSGCGFSGGTGVDNAGRILAVAAENGYGSVISQIGGKYVAVTSVMTDASANPHTFEAGPAAASAIAKAGIVVQNGLSYDPFMPQLESASSNSSRKIVSVQAVMDLAGNTQDPHLWYNPETMPQVASIVELELASIQPTHTAYFASNLKSFLASLKGWNRAIAQLKAHFAGSAVATTEPVADYLLQAAGLRNQAPWSFQSAVMQDMDPSSQDEATMQNLITSHAIKVLVYNEEVTDSVTTSLLDLAKSNGIPVVGVYETMPAGYDYQSWMVAETLAIQAALADGRSTPTL